jgi:hypothetical protein
VRGPSGSQLPQNRLDDPVDITEHVVVPKPKDTIPSSFHEGVAVIVPRIVAMLATIDLDDQALLPTRKICKIRTDRLLVREPEAG